MGFKPLFLRDITDEHLLLMQKLVKFGGEPQEWLYDLADHRLALFSMGECGLLGLSSGPGFLKIEFVVGQGLLALKHEIMDFVREKAEGRRIEMWTPRPGMMRLAESLGFEKELSDG